MRLCGQDPDAKDRVWGLLRTLERVSGFRVSGCGLSLRLEQFSPVGILQGHDQKTRLANAYAQFAAVCKSDKVFAAGLQYVLRDN